MTRNTATTPNKIALLATGDEITNGDILNSNSQIIAQKLFSNGMQVGTHMTVSDNIAEIERAMTFLLASHRALIITGGLGPTSDDITRYALGKVVQAPLVFSETTWDAICERFKILGYLDTPPEGNRQQALFPAGAAIIPNPNGTAAGCKMDYQDRTIFMLPGPPFECLPMVDQHAIPFFKQAQFQEILFYEHWLLFGVGESFIADQLDALAQPFSCTTGYRLAYPYIEFKLFSDNEKDFNTLIPLIEKTIQPYLLNAGKHPASVTLQDTLSKLDYVLRIRDLATGGLLENTLKTPETCGHVDFSDHTNPMIEITGLTEFWQAIDTSDTQLTISFADGTSVQKQIQLRGRSSRVKQYAVELISQQIESFIKNRRTD